MKKMMLVLSILLSLLMAVNASADQITFTIDVNNISLTASLVTVTVNRTSPTTADITFTSLTNGGDIFLMGDGGSVAVNVNATSWTLGTITGSNGTGFTPGPYSNQGSGNEDGFGSFNQKIRSFDGFTHSSDSIEFILTDTLGGTWASAFDVLTPNSKGYSVGAHIFVTAYPAVSTAGAIKTGFAANGGPPTSVPPPVPEPTTLLLLGSGLLGALPFVRRRFKK